MKCPFCAKNLSRVIDTREIGDGIRRRRECQSCSRRFTTYERVAPINLLVVKNDGRREEYNRDKLLEGIRIACAKRPIPSQVLEDLVDDISAQLYATGEVEIPSRAIGEMVMEGLKKLDDVAYVRFASVYRRFQDVDGMVDEIQGLKEWKREATAAQEREAAAQEREAAAQDKVRQDGAQQRQNGAPNNIP
ncbi:MAG: transcriptional repressor NrdR [Chloroflexi bacterium]|nr:transcriptional repressor NrdR [Chloroflexota bacterium]